MLRRSRSFVEGGERSLSSEPRTELLRNGNAVIIGQPLATADQIEAIYDIAGHELLACIEIPDRRRKIITAEGAPDITADYKRFFLFGTSDAAYTFSDSWRYVLDDWRGDKLPTGTVEIVDEAELVKLAFHQENEPLVAPRPGYKAKPGGEPIILGRTAAFGHLLGLEDEVFSSRQHTMIKVTSEGEVGITDLSQRGTVVTYVP